jgi:hypothetical protein
VPDYRDGLQGDVDPDLLRRGRDVHNRLRLVLEHVLLRRHFSYRDVDGRRLSRVSSLGCLVDLSGAKLSRRVGQCKRLATGLEDEGGIDEQAEPQHYGWQQNGEQWKNLTVLSTTHH